VIQLSGKPHPELKGLPHVDSFAKTDEDRQVFGLIFGAQTLGRVYVSPSGQPAARTKVPIPARRWATCSAYWMPALLAEELPEPDCPPVRVKLLGERCSRSATARAGSA
jgi:hypothetical protein